MMESCRTRQLPGHPRFTALRGINGVEKIYDKA